MVIDLHVALQSIESYFTEDTNDTITLGQMVGSQLFKHIFDLSLGYFDFPDILLIEGCQDYIGMSEPSPSNNHYYYGDLLTKTPKESLFNKEYFENPFEFKILNKGNPINEYKYSMNIQFINRFKLVIVCDAHLIPPEFISELKRRVSSKLIMLADPFTVYGKAIIDIPTVVHSSCECDPLTAMARDIYGVETDYIKKMSGKMLDVMHISAPQTTQKFQGHYYVTNDKPYYELMVDKFKKMGLRKGYSVIVTDKNYITCDLDPLSKDEINKEYITMGPYSLMEIVIGGSGRRMPTLTSNPSCSCRMNHFKKTFRAPIDLEGVLDNPFDRDDRFKNVLPGNLLTIEQAAHHRFDKLIFIQSEYHKLSKQEMYTLMSVTEHLTILEG